MEESISEWVSETLLIEKGDKWHLAITLPKSVKWSDYEKELAKVADGSEEINFRISSKPTKVDVGDRCYVVYDGYVRGWMTITDISEKEFRCTTTQKEWNKGWFVSRSGKFHYLDKPYPMKGFQGYRYVREGLFNDVY